MIYNLYLDTLLKTVFFFCPVIKLLTICSPFLFI